MERCIAGKISSVQQQEVYNDGSIVYLLFLLDRDKPITINLFARERKPVPDDTIIAFLGGGFTCNHAIDLIFDVPQRYLQGFPL